MHEDLSGLAVVVSSGIGIAGFVLAFIGLLRDRADVFLYLRIGYRVVANVSVPTHLEVHVVNVSNRPVVLADLELGNLSLLMAAQHEPKSGMPTLPRRLDTQDVVVWLVPKSVLDHVPSEHRDGALKVTVRWYSRRHWWQSERRRIRSRSHASDFISLREIQMSTHDDDSEPSTSSA